VAKYGELHASCPRRLLRTKYLVPSQPLKLGRQYVLQSVCTPRQDLIRGKHHMNTTGAGEQSHGYWCDESTEQEKRRARSEYWRELNQTAEHSGLTVHAFCIEQGVKRSILLSLAETTSERGAGALRFGDRRAMDSRQNGKRWK